MEGIKKMKALLISIHPKWCELIASGKKTVEVRKTKPKNLEMPFKCYIYCTNAKNREERLVLEPFGYELGGIESSLTYRGNGKVIGEFVCDEVCIYGQAIFDEQGPIDIEEIIELLNNSQLTYKELLKYVGSKDFYTLHISDFIIYDKPRELSEFVIPCNHKNECWTCDRYDYIGHM